MRVNILFEDQRYKLDVKPHDTTDTLLPRIKKLINFEPFLSSPYVLTETLLQLYYADVLLHPGLLIGDAGIVSGSTIKCKCFEKTLGNLKVNVRFLSTSVEIKDYSTVLKIGDIRTTLQNRLGIPVSVFRLFKGNVVLYDMHILKYYGIEKGEIINLELLEGTSNLITAALKGDIVKTLDYIPNYHESPHYNRYLSHVALFIAAHKDLAKLAYHTMLQGARLAFIFYEN